MSIVTALGMTDSYERFLATRQNITDGELSEEYADPVYVHNGHLPVAGVVYRTVDGRKWLILGYPDGHWVWDWDGFRGGNPVSICGPGSIATRVFYHDYVAHQ